jgi:hypothetical protein
MTSQRIKCIPLTFSFIQSSLSFVIEVICDLSNATNEILVINVIYVKKNSSKNQLQIATFLLMFLGLHYDEFIECRIHMHSNCIS